MSEVQDLNWHDQFDLLGVRVRAYFFDPTEVDGRSGFVAKHLPVLAGAAPETTRLIGSEGQREPYQVAGLLAHPDAVLQHGNGLICLSYRGGDGRHHEPARWRQAWRADVMLQCLATSLAVAGQRQQAVAAMWRGTNLLCQFDPAPAVLECLANHIGAAQRYWHEPQHISPAQLVSFCEPTLRALPGLVAPVALPA